MMHIHYYIYKASRVLLPLVIIGMAAVMETCLLYTSFNTGRAIPFFLKAWSESKVQSTKLNIIMSLSLYGEKGMEEFERLEKECTDKDDSILFKQVRVFDSYIKNLAR